MKPSDDFPDSPLEESPAPAGVSVSEASSEVSGPAQDDVAVLAEPTEDPGEGLPGLDRRRSIFLKLHKGAIIFFAVFGAYLISIYFDLWVNMGFTLLLDRAPDFFMKFVAVPIALEAGMGLAGLAVLYMLGRFVDLSIWPALISFWIGIHLLDMLMKWLLGQFQYGYGELRVVLLRLPGILLFTVCGYYVFRAALRRGKA
ncbi:hypothetical protein KKD52_14240 [Myxococcota bacterium]|nr:hypothetical protein [Myxococcota bacterium]MBU1412557.1 hypothetical protein [Myxococcota bacterium]MBU1511514.1 hypothetical protein [Myxococcota bacterium]